MPKPGLLEHYNNLPPGALEHDQQAVTLMRYARVFQEHLWQAVTNSIAAYLIIREYPDALAELCRALAPPFVQRHVLFEAQLVSDTKPKRLKLERAAKAVTYSLDRKPLLLRFPRWATRPLLVANLYTAEETRRRGAALEVVHTALLGIARRGKFAFATTDPSNIASQRTFTNLGFTVEHRGGDLESYVRIYRSPNDAEVRSDDGGNYTIFDPFSKLDDHDIFEGDLPRLELEGMFCATTEITSKVVPRISSDTLQRLANIMAFPEWLVPREQKNVATHTLPVLLEINQAQQGQTGLTQVPLAYVLPESVARYSKDYFWNSYELTPQMAAPGHTLILVNPQLRPEQVWRMLTSTWSQINMGRWITIAQVSPTGKLSGQFDSKFAEQEQIVMARL